jgi:hypothetical protein
VNIITVDLREIKLGCIDRIDLAKDRDWCSVLVNMVINIWVLYNTGKFLEGPITSGFSAELRSMKLVNLIPNCLLIL